MASCRACGAALGRSFRFCSQCGTAAGEVLDLFDLAPPVRDEVEVTYGRPGRFWAVVGGGVLAVLVGLWALSALAGGGVGAADGGDDAAGRHRTTTTTRPATSPTTEAAGATAPSAAEEATPGTGPTTSVVAGGGPLLGQPVGLSLLIGSEERLRRVDLDTGVVTGYEQPGIPLFATGGWVLLQSSSLVRVVPLADIGAAQASTIWSQYSPALPRPGPVEGQVWLPDAAGDTLVWRLVDAATRDVLQELDSGTTAWWQQPEAVIDPQVVGSSTGEVFERDGDGFRPVAQGELVGVGRATVLVRRCTTPGSCTLHWIDRSSWRETNGPVPDNRAQEVTATSISDDGRLLLYATASQSFLYDVSRGQEVAQVAMWPGGLSVSADGRWAVVMHIAGRIALYDTERGETIEVPLSSSSNGQVIVVPSV